VTKGGPSRATPTNTSEPFNMTTNAPVSPDPAHGAIASLGWPESGHPKPDADLPLDFEPLAPAKRSFVTKAASDGLRIGLATQYFPQAGEIMRELGCAWFPLRRMWVLRVSAMKPFLARLEPFALAHPEWSFDDLREQALSAWRSPAPDFFVSLFDLQVLPLSSGGFAITSVFDPLYLDAMRALKGRFHKFAGAWEVRAPREDILQALKDIAGIDETFIFVHERHVQLEQLVAAKKSESPITVAGAAPTFGEKSQEEQGLSGNGFITTFGTPLERVPVDEARLLRVSQECGLRDYQVDGVRHLVSRTSALLADDMGLGKTRQAVVAAHLAAGNSRILVVCPASLGINWEREIHALFPNDAVAMVGSKSMAQCKESRWIIANYERLGGLVREVELHIEVMLIDEAHYLKEHEAGRTRNSFILAERIPRIFLLTGTPILNREVEMHTLLRLSGHPIGQIALKDFRNQYAGSQDKRSQLAQAISEWMLRRGKDALKDLGIKHHQVRYVTPAEGLGGYNAILKNPLLQTMPKITKLRQHLEMLKLDFIVEAMQCIPAHCKAIIFCEFMDTVEHLRKALADIGITAVSLVGADSPGKRMKAVDAFQGDAGVRAFIGTTLAAGVGITLTAAEYVLFCSEPWTGALKRQAEDRAYRSGNTKDVFVITPIVPGTIDEQVSKLLNNKGEIETDVVQALSTSVVT
jgi:SNF2-related domain